MEQGQLIIEEGVEAISSRAYERRKDITSVVFPLSLKKIFYKAFFGCENLRVIELPKNIEYLGGSAFSCTKAIIFVPASIKMIDEYAFSKDDIVFFECGKDDFTGYHVKEIDDCPPPDYYHRGPYSSEPIEKWCFERGCEMHFNSTYEEFLKYVKEHA